MGALPFTDYFSNGSKAAKAEADGDGAPIGSPPIELGKLAVVEEIERSGALAFWSTDAGGRLEYLSSSLAQSLGLDPDATAMPALQQVLVPVSGEGEGRSLGLKLNTRRKFLDLVVRAADEAHDLVLKLSGHPSFDATGAFRGFCGSALDITEAHRSEEEADRRAKFDSLTGLANRHRMDQRIDSTLHAFRDAKRSAALMMLDLDKFKAVNDTLGHPAGDELLQQVAERLRGVIAGRGEIGRLGGDEFQVLIPDLDDRGDLGEIARKIIEMLSQPFPLADGRALIGCSVGIAIAPYDGVDRDELTRAADLALYASKNGGRGQFRFYAADLEHEANLRKRMEDDLAEAIEQGHFALEYQPVVRLNDDRVVSLEVQYSWQDEERGRVEQETFLPVAEGSRLIVPIGQWALTRACTDALDWPDGLRLSLPVSPVQFETAGYVDAVAEALETSGLDPTRLELRLPESVLLGEAVKVETALAALFKLGVGLVLDRFGSGLSSLSYLRRAPIGALRIGGEFFEPMLGNDLGDMELVRAVVALAGAMGMETVASGVHALDLMRELQRLGVDRVSGFVYSGALTAEEVREQIAGGEWSLEPTDNGAQRASRRTVFRKVGIIHEDHYYDVTLRNLSRSGAMIQGLEDVPVGTMFVLDFGQGQLAVCTVKRTMGDTQGLEFEQELVDDGAGGLCTRHRVNPYALAAAGVPLAALPPGRYALAPGGESVGGLARFALSPNAPRQNGRS